MTRCTRFEEEGLRILEEGGALDKHFSTCEDCIRARAGYDRLKGRLQSLDADVSLGDEWQMQVLARVKARPSQLRWRRFGLLAAGFAAIAVAVPVLFITDRGGLRPGQIELELVASSTVYRGVDANIGDQISVAAGIGDMQYAELRVYRDGDRLLAACHDSPPCQKHRDTISLGMTLEGLGEYQIVLVLSNNSVPAAEGELDTDVSAARDSGATVTLSEAVSVR